MFFANTIVIATHRRSGIHWTIDALRHNSPDINESYMSLEQIEARQDATIPLPKFRRQLLNMEGRVLMRVHDLPTAAYWTGMDERLFARTILHNSPTIYVHRDGRDVMVSLYLYMQSFSETVRNQTFTQFLRADLTADGEDNGLSRPGYWAHHARSWLEKDNRLAVSYVELETNYEATLRKMADFLGVSLNQALLPVSSPGPQAEEARMDGVLGKLGIRRKRNIYPEQPRLGRSGDWRSHFDKRDLEFFMGQAGDVMRQLGYAN